MMRGGETVKKQEEKENFVTEILSDMKRKFIKCRIALIVSMLGNVILAAVLIFK